MEIQKKIFLAAAGLISGLMLVSLLLPREDPKNQNAQLRVGAGDDISGLVVEQVIFRQGDQSPALALEEGLEGYEFQDC